MGSTVYDVRGLVDLDPTGVCRTRLTRALRASRTPLLPTDHDDSGLRAVLTRPRAYDAFQRLIGADTFRRWYVDTLLEPQTGWSILDIGCGPGTMVRFLPEGVAYHGFDMNARYIAFARQDLGDRGTFEVARVGDTPLRAGGFDVVMANAMLHHLDDAEASHLVDAAWAQLRPGGFLLTYDNAWVPEQSRLARWLIGHDRGRHVRTPAQYLELVQRRFADVRTTLRHDGYRIPYTLYTMKAVRP
ncbi:MAG: class I SAM-dependent methyltransferase [Myxococcales bacterium]|nr:class I SAM-dependent methyltransferase [Myxococcales bacterium]